MNSHSIKHKTRKESRSKKEAMKISVRKIKLMKTLDTRIIRGTIKEMLFYMFKDKTRRLKKESQTIINYQTDLEEETEKSRVTDEDFSICFKEEIEHVIKKLRVHRTLKQYYRLT